MKIREATFSERETLFDGDHGFVAEHDGAILGAVAFNLRHPGLFYAHSLFAICDPHIAALLFQKVRKTARALGYAKVDFVVSEGQPALLTLLTNKHVRVKETWLEIDS